MLGTDPGLFRRRYEREERNNWTESVEKRVRICASIAELRLRKREARKFLNKGR
jgi:hypothetical protein